MQTRRVTARQLLEDCLAKIDHFESRIHAWAHIDAAGARIVADQLDHEADGGYFRGPLHGIPLGIKDIFDVRGLPTGAGSPLRKNCVANSDAPTVAALRRAGAVIMGKTVTVEFACFDPSPTRNPWDTQLCHTPGGSSSGSAAALALGMCLGSVGSQTGGSLVRPSSYCGVATLKPTYDLLSREGVVPVSRHLDHVGPMARTVADVRVLFQALFEDAPTPPHAVTRPPRLGFLKSLTEQAAPAVQTVFQSALERLKTSGALVETVVAPFTTDEVLALHRKIMSVDAAEYHRVSFAENRASYGPKITTLLDEGLHALAVDYAAALAWRRQFREDVSAFCEPFDALIMPSTDTTAPATLDTTGTPHFQAPWSCAGVPAASMPCGLADDGMPVGMQLIAAKGEDWELLRTAEWCERCLGFENTPTLQ